MSTVGFHHSFPLLANRQDFLCLFVSKFTISTVYCSRLTYCPSMVVHEVPYLFFSVFPLQLVTPPRGRPLAGRSLRNMCICLVPLWGLKVYLELSVPFDALHFVPLLEILWAQQKQLMGTQLIHVWKNITNSNKTLVHRSAFSSVTKWKPSNHGGAYQYV